MTATEAEYRKSFHYNYYFIKIGILNYLLAPSLNNRVPIGSR